VPTLAWIVLAGLAMSLVALVGAVSTLLPEALLERLVRPLVGLAAGSLLGGACLHMLPESMNALGNGLDVHMAFVGGFTSFFVLEQFVHWHHCHRSRHDVVIHRGGDGRRPVGTLILLADGLHNFIGGLAVGGAFVVDVEIGIITWLVAAAHEVPQELGDFGVLVHSGWRRSSALAWNFCSALTFLVGACVAYCSRGVSRWRTSCRSPPATSSTSPLPI
jgi:zinc and cadmium transporter